MSDDDRGSDQEAEEYSDGEQYQGSDDDDDDDGDPFIDDDDSLWLNQEDFKPKEKKKDEDLVQAEKYFTGAGSKEATTRLVRDLNSIMKSDTKKFGYSAEPVQDNLYLWIVKFFGFEPNSDLAKDLERYKKTNNGIDYIELEMRFPSDYPWSPPFIFVKRPRFQFHTGHVTIGGSICMELLTKSGWTPANDIESILVQIRTEMIAGGARLDLVNMHEYTEHEARSTFLRVARQHGWEK
jgi:ubiquitin-conjugating enzyme E2 Q